MDFYKPIYDLIYLKSICSTTKILPFLNLIIYPSSFCLESQHTTEDSGYKRHSITAIKNLKSNFDIIVAPV